MTLSMVIPTNIKSNAGSAYGPSIMMQDHQYKQKRSTPSSPGLSSYDSSDGENRAFHHQDEDGADDGNNRPGEVITRPGEYDVLLGRGGGTNNHSGNVNFRKLVNEHKMRYLSCSKVEKPRVAREVVHIWRKQNPPGRFLQKKNDHGGTTASSGNSDSGSSKDDSLTAVWVEVSDKKAQEKASQCLRERTADVLPYLSQLQHHRDQMREQGMNMISQHFASGGGGPMGGDPSMSPYAFGGMAEGPFTPVQHRGMGNTMSNPMVMVSPAMMNNNNSSSNSNIHRRVSMPVGRTPAGTPGKPTGVTASNMAPSQLRRTSAPAMGSHLPGQHQRMSVHQQRPGMGGQRQNQLSMENRVLQDAYTAIEQSGGVDPSSVMLMEQMMEEQDMMERQAMMRERHAGMMLEQQQPQHPYQQNMMHSHGMTSGMSSRTMMSPGMSSGMPASMGTGGHFMYDNMIGMTGMQHPMTAMHGMGNMGGMVGDMSSGYPNPMIHQQQQQHQEMMMMQQHAHLQRMYQPSMKENTMGPSNADGPNHQQGRGDRFSKQQQSQMRLPRKNLFASSPTHGLSERTSYHNDNVAVQQNRPPNPSMLHSPPSVIDITHVDNEPLMSGNGSDDEPLPLVPDSTKSSLTSEGKVGRKRGNGTPPKLTSPEMIDASSKSLSPNGTDPLALSSYSKSPATPGPATPTRKRDFRNDDHVVNALSPIPIHRKVHCDHQHDEPSRGCDDDDGITAPLKGSNHLPNPTRKLKSAIKGSLPPRGIAGPSGTGVAAAAAAAAPTAPAGSGDGNSGSSPYVLREYCKTLEEYMTNHQITGQAAGGVDIDDDISDEEGDIGGVDASAWIQHALHDSGDASLNQTKKKKTKKDHRDHHDDDHNQNHDQDRYGGTAYGHGNNNDVPHHKASSFHQGSRNDDALSTDGRSMDGMSLMSLAVSELEHMERTNVQICHPDDSDIEEESVDFGGRLNKSGTGRSMASSHSVMSELTDLSDNDDDGDDGDVGDL